MADSPAGWYPQEDGQQRYWDGEKWTEHFAPGSGQAAAGTSAASAPAVPAAAATDAPSAARPWYKKKRYLVPGGLVGLVIIGSALTSGGGDAELAAATASPTPTATSSQAAALVSTPSATPSAPPSSSPAAPPPAPAPKVVSFDGSGIFEVGSEVKPGLYRSAGGGGYWERLKNASGDFEAILANDNPSGQAYVQIKKTDGYFSTNGMEEWVLVNLKAKGEQATSFSGDGMYMVGVDIKPGTYKSTGSGYWERLKGADGEFDSIIANGNPEGNAIVQIKSTDKFFSTSGMGDWKRMK